MFASIRPAVLALVMVQACATIAVAQSADPSGGPATPQTGHAIAGTDIFVRDRAYAKGTGDRLYQLWSAYAACSPGYENVRALLYSLLIENAERFTAESRSALAAGRRGDAGRAFEAARLRRRLVGWLPPAGLPEPCPPVAAPLFKVPGTAISLYDDDLAVKWGRRIDGLRDPICLSGASSTAYRGRREEAAAGIAEDRARLEAAAGRANDPATRRSLESDARALRQLEEALPPEVCPRSETKVGLFQGGSPGAAAGIALTGGLDVARVFDLGFDNAGFGDEQNVALSGVTAGAVLPGAGTVVDRFGFTFRHRSGSGHEATGPWGPLAVPHLLLQPTGGTQLFPAGLSGTGISSEVDLEEISADLTARLFPLSGLAPDGVVLTPVVTLGVSYLERDEQVDIRAGAINFFAVDARDVDVFRVSLGGGLELRQRASDDLVLFLEGNAALNLDIVDGQGTYHTAQTGVFDTTVGAHVSATRVTTSVAVKAGASLAISDLASVNLSGYAAARPWWELDYRPGRRSGLDHDMKAELGGRLELLIQLQPRLVGTEP